MPSCCHHNEKGPSPIAQLRAEHEVILRAVTVLERVGQDLEEGKTVDSNWLVWLVDFFSNFVDGCHHEKEEHGLFPLLEQHGIPREGGPVGMMIQEHEQGRDLIRALSFMSESERERIPEIIRRYSVLLRGHIKKENEVLFHLAEQVLSDQAQRELAQAFHAMEKRNVGAGVHQRFIAELEQLEALSTKLSGERAS
ncbi:MAG: hemerythrin domain-containing protein [Nitrospirales bacterium]|nr:hemerythrin domain-containing protein [Nitrospirales bacterium]